MSDELRALAGRAKDGDTEAAWAMLWHFVQIHRAGAELPRELLDYFADGFAEALGEDGRAGGLAVEGLVVEPERGNIERALNLKARRRGRRAKGRTVGADERSPDARQAEAWRDGFLAGEVARHEDALRAAPGRRLRGDPGPHDAAVEAVAQEQGIAPGAVVTALSRHKAAVGEKR